MKSLFLSFALVAGSAVLPAADGPSVAGQWKLHSNISGYESDFACSITQNNQEISGTCKGSENEVKIAGKVDAKKVTFQYKTDYQGQELTVVHDGTLDASGKIAGSVDVQPMGVGGDFTATPVK